MKRITSIKNAIKYFEKGTRRKTNRTRKGEEYISHVPPEGFKKLSITERFYDTEGRVAGTVTQLFESFQWKDYASIIRQKEPKILKLVVYYE